MALSRFQACITLFLSFGFGILYGLLILSVRPFEIIGELELFVYVLMFIDFVCRLLSIDKTDLILKSKKVTF